MSDYAWTARHVLGPGLDVIRGTRTMQRLAELEELQWQPEERIRQAQAAGLRRLVTFCFDRVPYYRAVMEQRGLRPDDVQDLDDIRKLPCLTRDVIRTHFGDLLATGTPESHLRSGWSGGTTGERLDYRSTREERLTYAQARWLLSLEWTGARLGETHLSIRQGSQPPAGRAARLLNATSLRLQRLERVDTMSVTDGNLAALVGLIQRTKPRSLFAYPSALALIASHARDHGQPCPVIHAVCVGGERLQDRQRALLRNVFGSEPYTRYGSNELHSVAAQCEARAGLHVHAGDFIVEVADADGNPVPPGERGRLLVTSLHNHGMPFIRYENGDIASLALAPCPCGRGLPVLDSRIGRTIERLHGQEGRQANAMDLDLGCTLPPGVVHYQLVQESVDRFVLSAVPAADTGVASWTPVAEAVANALAGVIGSRPVVELRLVPEIAMNLSGKRLPFVSRLDANGRSGSTRPQGPHLAGLPLE